MVSEEERRLRALLLALCEGDGSLTADTSSLASRVGVPVAARYQPFALTVLGEGAIRHGQMAADLRTQNILALTEGDRISGLLAEGQELRAYPGMLLAVDALAPRGELTALLERVRLVIDLGRRLGRTGHLTADDIALEMLLAGSPDTADSLVARVITPLRAPLACAPAWRRRCARSSPPTPIVARRPLSFISTPTRSTTASIAWRS